MSLIKTYGLIGNPIKHSLSPVMHNSAFKALNIDSEYKLFELKEKELAGFLESLKENNIQGLNVTYPYKEKVVPLMTSLSVEAGLVGVVNTIRFFSDGLEGFNTDGEGFYRHLSEDLKFSPSGKNIAILGAGGAARAIAVYLCKSQPSSIAIYDIDQSRIRALIERLRYFKKVNFKAVESVHELGLKDCSLLVNCTPVGMKQNDPLLVNPELIHKDLLVYDLIYGPQDSRLLWIARERGAVCSNGLGMLLHQGALAFKIWTGQDAPLAVMRQALEDGMKDTGHGD
ncbi:MAG: shikimate dehydrogenase [Candidatus Omnitrophota bacterium]